MEYGQWQQIHSLHEMREVRTAFVYVGVVGGFSSYSVLKYTINININFVDLI